MSAHGTNGFRLQRVCHIAHSEDLDRTSGYGLSHADEVGLKVWQTLIKQPRGYCRR